MAEEKITAEKMEGLFEPVLGALDDAEDAAGQVDEAVETARGIMREVEGRYARLRGRATAKDVIERLRPLVERYGPTVAKWVGGPGAGAAAAALLADEGAFDDLTGALSGVLGLLPSLFGG